MKKMPLLSGQSYNNLSSHYKEVRTYLLKTTKITFIILKSQFLFQILCLIWLFWCHLFSLLI